MDGCETHFAPPKKPWNHTIPLQIPTTNCVPCLQTGAGFRPSTVSLEYLWVLFFSSRRPKMEGGGCVVWFLCALGLREVVFLYFFLPVSGVQRETSWTIGRRSQLGLVLWSI